MNPITHPDEAKNRRKRPRFSLWRRMARSRDGAAAIEFAILAIPYFLIIFATLETFVAYTAEQIVANAVNVMAREVRTGNITYNLGRDTDMTMEEFRVAFCDQISVVIACSATEAATPQKLYLDLETLPTFAAVADKVGVPRINGGLSDLDTSAFHFSPGGPDTINLLRAYYRWDVTMDLLRSISNIRPDSQTNQVLLIATTAFRNEEYP